MAQKIRPLPKFEWGGAEIQLFLKPLDEDDQRILEDYAEAPPQQIGGVLKSNNGTARAYAVHAGVHKLIVDNKEIKRKGDRLQLPDPPLRNEDGVSLGDKILMEMCKRETHLASNEPYSRIFGKFLPDDIDEDDEDEMDPTEDPDGY